MVSDGKKLLLSLFSLSRKFILFLSMNGSHLPCQARPTGSVCACGLLLEGREEGEKGKKNEVRKKEERNRLPKRLQKKKMSLLFPFFLARALYCLPSRSLSFRLQWSSTRRGRTRSHEKITLLSHLRCLGRGGEAQELGGSVGRKGRRRHRRRR